MVPSIIKPYVISFCRGVVADPKPEYIAVDPLSGEESDECFVIVPRHATHHGGSNQIGWAIWEWPKVFIEAEFHAVWRRLDGSLLDISPRAIELPGILFLPDPKRKYRGRQVDNVRKPLIRNRDISRYCELAHLIYVEQNKGELADYHGPLPVTPIMESYFDEKSTLFERLCRKYGHPTAPG